MRGFDIKQIRMRSFQISGLTAKWGIGNSRKPSIWDNNLVAWWDARTFPDGDLATIPNTATMEGKAPDLTVTGATMSSGTLQFDGVNDEASTAVFLLPDSFTVFWDIDWLGDVDTGGGIAMSNMLSVANKASTKQLSLSLGGNSELLPNTVIGMQTDGKVYNCDGSIAFEGLQAVTTRVPDKLYIAHVKGTNYTQMGFRQLLIFNKELSPTEVNEVLTTMFPV